MSLLRAHKSVFEVVRDALAADSTLSHIKVSVGARFQGEQNPEVIIQQSSFDINDLNTADYGAFEISVFCYANTYTEAAKIADTVFTAIQENDLYTLTEQELIAGSDPEQYNISQTLYHLKGLDLFLEHYDEDGYEANVLVRAIEAEDTTTGVGDYIPKTSGSPAPFYAQLDSRIQDLSDVNVNSLGEGQILKYDVSEGEWVNADLPLFANNGLVSSNVNGITLLSLADSQTFTTASTSGDLTVGGNLNFTGPQTKLIRPFDLGQSAGPLTIQSNGDLVIELDENADELDKAFIVKNGANSEVFKVDEAGNVTVNQEYILPTTDGGTDYFLKTDGSGQLYFATLYGTSGNTGGAPPPAIDTISELLDTQISSLADNQILRYDSGSSKWVNEDLTLAQSIGDLTDVDTTTVAPTDGQALVWNNTNSEWQPGDISSFTELSSVNYWFYDGKFHDSDNESQSQPLGVYFKSDGTKMYIVGGGSDDVNEYALSTAWDPSTATFTQDQYLSPTPTSCYISPDGSKFFWADSNARRVYYATMDTAWDVSDDSWTKYYNSNDSLYDSGFQPQCLYFKPDGTKLYVGYSNGDTIYEYNLTTAWDLTTASRSGGSYLIHDVNTNSQPRGLTISDDGLKMYVVDQLENIQEFEFSTAWDISTATFLGHQSIGEPDTAYEDIYYNASNSDYAFIVGDSNNRIYRFNTKAVEPSDDGTFTADRAYIPKIYTSSISGNNISCSGAIVGGNGSGWTGQANGGSMNVTGLYTNGGFFNVRNNQKGILFAPSHSNWQNNTASGTGIMLSPSEDYLDNGRRTILIPSVNGTLKTDQDTFYLGRFDSEAESKVTGATEDIEYYFTARADGQGEFQRQLGALPASGQTLTRTSYYSDKAFADPDTAADWTQGTAYTSTSLASSISQSTDTLLNAQSTGTPPLSTKIVISNYLGSSGFVSGDADGFGGTSVAYSLRLLNHTYGGAAIRVVNDSDVEADIGFDSNYELDTTALLSHCGSGDGYLVKWYDQAKGGSTGDGNDATWESSTSYSSRKPQIVSAGSVITDNGKPCLETIDAGMVMDEQFSASNEYDLFFVAQKTLNNNNHGMIWGTQTGNDCRVWLYDYRLYLEVNNGENNNDGYGDGGANTRWHEMGQLILNVRRDSSDVNTAQRNDVVGDHNYTRNGAMKTDRILNAWNNQQYSFAGNVQEIIMLDGDKSSERSAILSNLNTYYSVY